LRPRIKAINFFVISAIQYDYRVVNKAVG